MTASDILQMKDDLSLNASWAPTFGGITRSDCRLNGEPPVAYSTVQNPKRLGS